MPPPKEAFLFDLGHCGLVEIQQTFDKDLRKWNFDGGEYGIINANNRHLFTHHMLHTALELFLRGSSTFSEFLKSQIDSIKRVIENMAGSKVPGQSELWMEINLLAKGNASLNPGRSGRIGALDEHFQTAFRDSVHDYIHLQNIDYAKGFKCCCSEDQFENADVFGLAYDNACGVNFIVYACEL
jgi:hypothetical protein